MGGFLARLNAGDVVAVIDVGTAFVALAFVSTLMLTARKPGVAPPRWALLLFGALIIADGLGRSLDVWLLARPDLSGAGYARVSLAIIVSISATLLLYLVALVARTSLASTVVRHHPRAQGLGRNDAAEEQQMKADQLRLAVEAGQVGIWEKNLRTGERTWSVKCKELFGLPLDAAATTAEVLAKIHPEDKVRMRLLMDALEAREDLYSREFRILPSKGRPTRWVSIKGKTFCDEASVPTKKLGTMIDVSNLKLLNALVTKQADRLKSVVDHVVDGIVTINDEFQIESWNPAAKKIFGYDADEVLGRNVNMLMPEPYHSEHDGYVANYLRTGQAKIIGRGREVTGLRKDGSTFPMDLAISEFRQGSQRLFTGIIRDITERLQAIQSIRAAMEQAEVARQQAEVANHTKSAFLANMSHEIRTPLGAILGFAELLVSSDQTSSDRATCIAAMKRNGDLLTAIIGDILDLSKVEAGKIDIEERDVSLTEVLTDVTTLLKLKASDKGIALRVTFEGPVPRLIRTDPLRLRQILINIVGNAIKFTDRGGIDVAVQVLPGSVSRPQLKVKVADTGSGISPEHAQRLFEPFSQADVSSTRKYGGTGLGLVLAKRLAQLLGGDVYLEQTQMKRGSTFVVVIACDIAGQASQAAPVAAESVESPSEAEERIAKLGGVLVLLVEDSPDNRLIVSHLLKRAGASVDTAENGRVAIERVRVRRYDLLLMDLQMPVMDGYEAITAMRKEGLRTPVIALTAHALKDVRDRCLAAGFDDHIAKPIDRLSLVNTVARHVFH